MRRQWPVILLACVAVVAAFGLIAASGVFRPAPPPAAVGGPFSLIDQNGRSVDQTALRGKWNIVFFGFTFCPDVCPATLQTLAETSELLGPRARDLRIVFISVDPERDTVAVMKAYAEANRLPEGSLALTGAKAQTDEAARVYRVIHEKAGDGPDYTINHSTPAYLMDPQGRFVDLLPYGLTPEQMAEEIRKAMRGR